MVRKKIATFMEHLPDNIVFNLPNMRNIAANDGAASIFINFNILFHCVVVVVHCPAMFWTTDIETASSVTPDPPRAEFAWTVSRLFALNVYMAFYLPFL